jgi:guanosine-3',5'-bis(diphosphate) 3'-pyrophosphohydrolase
VTNDKSKAKAERNRLQVEEAATKSSEAKLVKLADKISNLRDIVASPPANWPQERKAEYFKWAMDVVSGLRGVSPQLEAAFDKIYAQGIGITKGA